MSKGRAQGVLRNHLDMCWVSKLPNKTKKIILAKSLCHDMTSPSLTDCSDQLSNVIKLSSCILSQFFSPSDQRGLLKTEKHLDQVEFYWKASEEPDLCVNVSGDINKGYFLYQI